MKHEGRHTIRPGSGISDPDGTFAAPASGREELEPAELRDIYDRVVLDGLAPVALALGVVVFAFSVYNLLWLPSAISAPVVAHDIVVLLVLVTTARLAARGRIAPRWAHPVGALVAVLMLSSVLLEGTLAEAPLYTNYIALLVIATGSFLLSRRWLAGCIALVLVAWFATLYPLTAGEGDRMLLVLTLAIAVLLSIALLAARRRSYARLELAALRRRQLEERLRSAQKLKAVGTLAAGVAHDFNNLLTAILGYGSLLETDPGATARQREAAAEIVQAATRGAGLTAQLLGFARKGKVRVEATDVGELVREAASLLSRTLDERIDVQVDAEGARALVMGDPEQLYNVVLNLAINARDAMPEGGTLVLRVRRADHHRMGPRVELHVEDTGAGIPAEIRDRIFEPFFTTKPEALGTGMGLPMVYGVVRNHGGEIELQSAPGRGTTVRVWLPAVGGGAPASTP